MLELLLLLLLESSAFLSWTSGVSSPLKAFSAFSDSAFADAASRAAADSTGTFLLEFVLSEAICSFGDDFDFPVSFDAMVLKNDFSLVFGSLAVAVEVAVLLFAAEEPHN